MDMEFVIVRKINAGDYNENEQPTFGWG